MARIAVDQPVEGGGASRAPGPGDTMRQSITDAQAHQMLINEGL